MQHGGQYGGGLYPGPPMPPDHASLLYDGTYGSSPGSAPSAPAYAQASQSYYQPAPSSSPSVPAYNSHSNVSFSEQPSNGNQPNPYSNVSFSEQPSNGNQPNPYSNVSFSEQPSYGNQPNPYSSVNPNAPLQDHSPASAPQSNSYPPSYAPVVPSYPSLGSYERSSEMGSGSFDSSLQQLQQQQHSHYGSPGYGAAPQPSAGYESYGQGNGGFARQGDQGYGGVSYDQRTEYEKTRYDQGAGYGNVGYGVSDSGNYGSRAEPERNHDNEAFLDVYAYDGGSAEPYGARGTGGSSWSGGGGVNSSSGSLGSNVIARASSKVEGNTDSSGVQKFRVKLLPEPTSNDSSKDVVCQIGLDGVRMMDPSTSRTLRIYPLDTIAKWEVKEASIFTFWAKSSVDVDNRIIQLKSSSYTTTAILDTLTAACVQLCEMKDSTVGESNGSVGSGAGADKGALKKGSVLDWVALRPRATTVDEKQHWVPDEAVSKCNACGSEFGAFFRRHHCRNCGDIFCDKCTRGRTALTADDPQIVRVCDRCLAEVTQRLDNSSKPASRINPQRTHEDLAKKLQEEMERNQAARKQNSGRPTTSGNGNSGQTSVMTCAKCGAISLVTGSSRGCSSCGANSGNLGSASDKNTSFGYSSSAGQQGPPHLWSSDAPKSNRAAQKTREVACPTCTVHLQVQVPNFGTEQVECGVCQHPFLVSA